MQCLSYVTVMCAVCDAYEICGTGELHVNGYDHLSDSYV